MDLTRQDWQLRWYHACVDLGQRPGWHRPLFNRSPARFASGHVDLACINICYDGTLLWQLWGFLLSDSLVPNTETLPRTSGVPRRHRDML